MRCAIAGGGIGGLVTALSLHAAGLRDVVVWEATPAIRQLGVGINLLPHAVRELTVRGEGQGVGDHGAAVRHGDGDYWVSNDDQVGLQW